MTAAAMLTRPSSLPVASGLELRDYQVKALQAIGEAGRRGVRRQLVVLPTGAGKTVVFSHLLKRRPGRALVVAHREELLTQAAEKIRLVDPSADIGIVRAELNEIDARITIASIQTIARSKRLAMLGADIKSVVIDEAHHATAETYGRVLTYLGAFESDGPFVLGCTATPERGDRVGLGEVFEEITYSMTILEAIAGGYLCDLSAVRVALATDFSDVKVRHGDLADGDLGDALMAANAPQFAVSAYLQHAQGRKALCFTPTIATAEAFSDAFCNAGVRAEWLSGDTPRDERQAILARLKSGQTSVVANCGVLLEGYDEPSISCIVVARPTKSRPLYQQMIGRGTRLYPGKSGCLVIDLVGSSSRHELATVASLVGLKPSDLARRSVTEALEAKQHQEEEEQQLSGRVVTLPVDLFRSRPMHWIQSGRSFVLPSGNGRIALEPDGDRWNVLSRSYNEEPRVLASNLPLEYAQGFAEDHVRALGAAHLADPNAAWRQGLASEKQRALLASRGLPIRPGLTKGEASDLIASGQRGCASARGRRWRSR
jgi:ATP-dependent helicase IRC3